MVNYTHISLYGEITEKVIEARDAARMIGDRVLIGFNVVQRYIDTSDGREPITYFQSDVTGAVWAIYSAR